LGGCHAENPPHHVMILKISLDFSFLPMITATLLYLSVMTLSETVGDRHHYIHDWEFFASQFFSIISILLGASQAQESELTCAETGCMGHNVQEWCG
jgi:hypothetical protein